MAVQAVMVGPPQRVVLVERVALAEQGPKGELVAVAQEIAVELHRVPGSLAVYILVQLVLMDHRPR